MKKLLSIPVGGMVVLVFLLSLSTVGMAQCPWAGRFAGYPGQCYFYANIPDLTTEQQTKIDALRTEYWKELEKNRMALQQGRLTLRQLRAEENIDLRKVNRAIDEINELQGDMTKRQIKFREDIRQLLTADQRKYFDNAQGPRSRGNWPGRGLGPCGRLNG